MALFDATRYDAQRRLAGVLERKVHGPPGCGSCRRAMESGYEKR